MRHAFVPVALWFMLASVADAAGQAPAQPDAAMPLSKALASDQRLTALTPEIRGKVLAEADHAKAHCGEWVVNFYECDCLARQVFDHRFKVGTAIQTRGSATRPATGAFTVPLTAILADTELNARACLSPERLTAWVRARLVDPKMTDPKRTCIADGVVAGFRSAHAPGISQVDGFMRTAIDACAGRD